MGIVGTVGIQGFERRLEHLIEGTFARVFRSGLNPVELGRKLVRTLDDKRSVGVNGRVIVPNDFTFVLAEDDYEQMADMAGVLARDLGDAAREHARDMGYSFAGPIQTTFEVSPDLRPGVFEVEVAHKEGDGSPVGSLLLPTGDRVPLGQYVVSVGRQTDCTIVLGDPKVSRRHAEVRPSGSGFVLVDLNSTNGSYVNRQRISQHQLVDGDELGFGHTYFFFEAF